MSHFRILIPNSTGQPIDELRRVGLAALLSDTDRPPTAAPLNNGPRGMRGLCVSWDPDHITQPGVQAPRYEYDEKLDDAIEAPFCPPIENQQSKIENQSGRFWLLIEKSRPVTPNDVKRKPVDSFDGLLPTSSDPEHVRLAKSHTLKTLARYAGNAVTLGDGHDWTFPNLAELPTRYQFHAAQNEWDRAVEPKFRTTYDRIKDVYDACRNRILWDLVRDYTAEQIHEVLSPSEREFLATCSPAALDDHKVAVPFLCEMLALNYRVTPWLIDQLGLLKPSNLWQCLCACVDADALTELHRTVQKKIVQIQARGSSSSSGEADASTTNPPSEISG